MEDFTKVNIKFFFTRVHNRFKLKINITTTFAAMVTRQGKTELTSTALKKKEHETCVCNKGNQQ